MTYDQFALAEEPALARVREQQARDVESVRAMTPRSEIESFVRAGGRLEGLLAEAFADLAAQARERAQCEFETQLPVYAGMERR